MKLINVGYGNMVAVSHIIAIVSPDSAPIKRMVQDAKERGNAIDATFGRRSDHVILSAIQPRHIASRLENRGDGAVAGDAPYESEEKDENEQQ